MRLPVHARIADRGAVVALRIGSSAAGGGTARGGSTRRGAGGRRPNRIQLALDVVANAPFDVQRDVHALVAVRLQVEVYGAGRDLDRGATIVGDLLPVHEDPHVARRHV